MKAFDDYKPYEVLLAGYDKLDDRTLEFFKDTMIKTKELVTVNENHEDSPLYEKMQALLEQDAAQTYTAENGVTIFMFEKPFPFVHGDDNGFHWFVLPRAKALEL